MELVAKTGHVDTCLTRPNFGVTPQCLNGSAAPAIAYEVIAMLSVLTL